MAAAQKARPDALVIAAAQVGGIMGNSTFPIDFLNDNLRIQTHLFEAAHLERLLLLGSSCIYPRGASQPIAEEAPVKGPLEPTNQAYTIVKITGLEEVRAYRQQYGRRWIAAMPTNLYGPADNFDPVSGHLIPALIHRFHHAGDDVVLWGTGTPRRWFLFSDDAADALVHLLENCDGDEHVKVGTGRDISIADLARLAAAVVGFDGTIACDPSKPDGTPRKRVNVSCFAGGCHPTVSLENGIAVTDRWYVEHRSPMTGAPLP